MEAKAAEKKMFRGRGMKLEWKWKSGKIQPKSLTRHRWQYYIVYL